MILNSARLCATMCNHKMWFLQSMMPRRIPKQKAIFHANNSTTLELDLSHGVLHEMKSYIRIP